MSDRPNAREPSAQRLEAKGGDSDAEREETAGGGAGSDLTRRRRGDERGAQRLGGRSPGLWDVGQRRVRLVTKTLERNGYLRQPRAQARGCRDVSLPLVEDQRLVDRGLDLLLRSGECKCFG